MNLEYIKGLIKEIDRRKGKSFSGIGLIFYNSFSSLPVSPLKSLKSEIKLPIKSKDDIIDFLIEISTLKNEYHDGFHLISEDFYLTHICQFFSTPIVENARIDFEFGSRNRSALYGSYLNSVIACAVCGPNQQPIIYQKGEIIKL